MKLKIFIISSVILLLLLLTLNITVDQILFKNNNPKESLKNFDDFITWKGDKIKKMGYFIYEDKKYTVYLTTFGRLLPSGPCAYLFDLHGNYIDWTSDMGDLRTNRYKFDLTSGNVKDIIPYSRKVAQQVDAPEPATRASPASQTPQWPAR